MADHTFTDASSLTSPETIVATWGGSTANCYTTYAYANDWIAGNVLDPTPWTSATVTQRTAALLTATRQVDSRQYIYDRKYGDQTLELPRVLPSGAPLSALPYDTTVVSELEERMENDVKYATCLQAVHVLKQLSYASHETMRMAGVKALSKVVGPVTESFQYGSAEESRSTQGGRNNPLCEDALSYLRNWMTSRKIYRG